MALYSAFICQPCLPVWYELVHSPFLTLAKVDDNFLCIFVCFEGGQGEGLAKLSHRGPEVGHVALLMLGTAQGLTVCNLKVNDKVIERGFFNTFILWNNEAVVQYT
jgi:hypothetical protein